MPKTISKKRTPISLRDAGDFQKSAKKSLAKKVAVKSKAVRQANKITSSLHEAHQIETGKKKAKSFSKFLGEL